MTFSLTALITSSIFANVISSLITAGILMLIKSKVTVINSYTSSVGLATN